MNTWTPAPDDAEWTASISVFQEAIIAAGFEADALEALNAWADDSELRARAITSVQELDFGPVSLIPPTETSFRRRHVRNANNENFIKLGPAFWTGKRRVSIEDELSSWESGIFVLVDNVPQLIKRFKGDETFYRPVGFRHVVYGVEFLREDVDRLLQVMRSTKRKGRSSPRRKKWEYAPVLAKLESEVESGKISRLGGIDDWGVQAEIEREIANATTDSFGGPSEATVRRKAQGIMELWRMKLAQ